MPQPGHILFISPSIFRVNGSSPNARRTHGLCRALTTLGHAPTVVTWQTASCHPEQFGLAKRLAPLTIHLGANSLELTQYEGILPDGQIPLIVVGKKPGVTTIPLSVLLPLAALHYAKNSKQWPTIVQADYGAEIAVVLAKTLFPEMPAPGTVCPLDDLQSTAILDHSLQDLLNLPQAIHEEYQGDVRAMSIALADKLVSQSPRLKEKLAKARPDAAASAKLFSIAPGIDSHLLPVSKRPRMSADKQIEHVSAEKKVYRNTLQRQLGLTRTDSTALISVIGPFHNKILSTETINAMLQNRAQFVFLADREEPADTVRLLEASANAHPAQIAFTVAADRAIVQRVVTAADFALFLHAPPQSDPNQLSCLHCGAIPIAPRSGVFSDRLVDFDNRSESGSGFLFHPEDSQSMAQAIRRALLTYSNQNTFRRLYQRIINFDLSWTTAAVQHLQLYDKILSNQHIQATLRDS